MAEFEGFHINECRQHYLARSILFPWHAGKEPCLASADPAEEGSLNLRSTM